MLTNAGRTGPGQLFVYLLNQLMYDFDQKQYGHPGFVVIRSNAMADLNVSEQELSAMIYELENWSDFNRQPSLTCLFRIPVPVGGKPCYGDIHTHLTGSNPHFRAQRHLVEMRKHEDGNYRLFLSESSGLDTTDPLPIVNLEQTLETPGVLERDKVYALYLRLSHPANVENALVMTPFQN